MLGPLFARMPPVLVEVCARCEARARMAGELDESLKTLLARGLRRREGPPVKVKGAPCLYRCPLRGVTVKVGGDPQDPSVGTTRVFVPRRDESVLVEWALTELRRASDDRAD